MTLYDRLYEDLKTAMKAHDELRVNTLRMLIAACKYYKVEKYGAEDKQLSDEEVLAVLGKQIKQRKDSISSYTAAGRDELAGKEHKESVILSEYMPPQLSEDETKEKILEIKQKMNVTSLAQAGVLIGAVMKELKGSVDGATVQKAVKDILSEEI